MWAGDMYILLQSTIESEHILEVCHWCSVGPCRHVCFCFLCFFISVFHVSNYVSSFIV